MNDAIRIALQRATSGSDLTASEMRSAVAAIMDGESTEVEIAALLAALKTKGEAVDEIVGAAQAMRDHATRIECTQTGLLDTCGTGGDALHTFNISTATALVVSAVGVPVAKHGNRSVSSSSGAADVLEALGVNVQIPPEHVARCIDQLGIGFCFAPLLHGAMKYAAPVRKQLGIRTIFNLLGPLTNPAGAEFQLVGTNQNETAEKLANALARLNCKRALVVCGAGELDEISLWGESIVFTVTGNEVSVDRWTAGTFGLPECRVDELRVNSPDESAELLRRIFAGEQGAARNIVLANSAAALVAASRYDAVRPAVEAASEAIDSGKAAELCRRLAAHTNA